MNPIFRKVKTQAEKDALIADARRAWDAADELVHLLGGDQENYLAQVTDSIEVESPAFVQHRELTAVEKAELDTEQGLLSCFGGVYAPVEIPDWYRPIHEQEQRASFEKLVGPAIRERNSLEAMFKAAIEKAVREQLAKGRTTPSVERQTIPIRRLSEREAIHPAMAAVAGDDSDAGRLVKAWLENNREAMREIVRRCELAAA